MTSEQPPTFEDCEADTPLTIKCIPMDCRPVSMRRRQFFDSIDNTMDRLLNDGETSDDGTL